jgi:hypothetical protein
MANLDDNQKQQVKKWLDEGLKLSEIQNRMATEMNLKLTYMELRFLLDDLSLKPKDPEPPKEEVAKSQSSDNQPKDAEAELLDEPAATPGGVSVSVDQIARPGTIVSGKVTFSDGNKAEWYLDQTGRLGVVPAKEGYKPAQADLLSFQNALQGELAKLGF